MIRKINRKVETTYNENVTKDEELSPKIGFLSCVLSFKI